MRSDVLWMIIFIRDIIAKYSHLVFWLKIKYIFKLCCCIKDLITFRMDHAYNGSLGHYDFWVTGSQNVTRFHVY